MPVQVEVLSGAAVSKALDSLAHLRISVFRDWPYLYDGDAAYERRYLKGYAQDEAATLVAALEGDRVVGAATGMPLEAHGDASALVLPKTAPPRDKIYYCAESVLLPAYRGQGIGHHFFDLREAAARNAGFTTAIFASVIRPEDHPMHPSDYRPLEPFWRKRGYAPLAGASLSMSWRDIGEKEETEKPFQIWMRDL